MKRLVITEIRWDNKISFMNTSSVHGLLLIKRAPFLTRMVTIIKGRRGRQDFGDLLICQIIFAITTRRVYGVEPTL